MAQVVLRDGATGQAIVSGPDIPVDAILERLVLSGSVERVLEVFPGLTPEGFAAAIAYAAIAVRREVRYDEGPHVGVKMVRETAAAYGSSGDPDDALLEVEAAYGQARYELELVAGLRNGFRDLAAGRVVPHAEFMAELRAMLPA
jgi:uncharacterized protein (DUF433 family)